MEVLLVGGVVLVVAVLVVVILVRGRRRSRAQRETEPSIELDTSGKRSPRAKAARARRAVLRMREQTRWMRAPQLVVDIIRKGEIYQSVEAADAAQVVSLEDVARMKVALSLIFAVVGLLVGVLLQQPLFAVLLVLGGAVFGFIAPDSSIRRAATARQTSISRALPLAMDVIGLAVERSTIDAGINYYIQYFGYETLAEELDVAMQRTRIKKERLDVAIGEMLRKNHNDDLTFLVAAVGQATQLGGTDLRQMMASRAIELRVKREQTVKERSLRAPVLMTFPVMLNVLALLVALGGLAALQLTGGPK